MSIAVDHTVPPAIAEEELFRAQVYALLARLLARAPDAAFLSALGELAGEGGEFGAALDRLADAARGSDPAAVEEEFTTLFIGVGGSERTPYGSFYLTGFLNEKPLAELRADMARLGIARADDVSEPEDHIAALCEMMAGLIGGEFAPEEDGIVGLDGQRTFFDRHVGSWAGRFFADLETSPSARFYRAVGAVGLGFLAVEARAFDLAA
ncbi:molecular chaperone TorD [Azospirillum sp. TSH100]|uniref:TorD/DmsD family molecular chaperone n=1 Tax=Azospirillum sp. TSH100 TaxID=652764 RepID=UPI000D605140|nr:molecular chaperone TorD family protein [Azospirillum sp. TSH100]PWC84485.1 molecular chaperone TorD [Azospirillum sp. TSH100]QCG87603.1 molecular chaperone TorD [Azospirillum sp. TSH100]